ncbi:hypothetical protein K0817_005605 [Microbacterium sp. HD4P20]|uniref:hypothetical protein n=1 Tax=Microbacterium sp. HD4P20 TaxID=2864874 RepID=UPI0020A28F0E|nr:hypothetical protein [Microbacterium sp. HD4P20]MCP2636043.1 hypothetical protein [Microbacterium sp. HD4P20]
MSIESPPGIQNGFRRRNGVRARRRSQREEAQMQTSKTRRGAFAAVATIMALTITACAADNAGETGDSPPDTPTYRSPDGTCAAEPLEGVDYDRALELYEYFEEASTGIPQTEPLPEPVAPDTTVVFLDNGSAVGALMWDAAQRAASTAGVQLTRVDSGLDAQSINTAVSTVAENPPDIMISAAVDATFYQSQIEQLEAAGTTIVYGGSANGEQFGLLDSHSGLGATKVNGQVLAASAVVLTCGRSTDFVFYNIPEFSFSQIALDAANDFLAEVVPGSTMRVVDIPVATMDTTAGDAVISDLQANPDTEFFITVADQIQIGLKNKMDLAGIDVPGIGQWSLPPNIEQVASNLQAAAYAVDIAPYTWLLFDEGFRRHQGEDVVYDDWTPWVKGISRVLTEETAADYPNGLFVAYPGYVDEFAEIWGK